MRDLPLLLLFVIISTLGGAMIVSVWLSDAPDADMLRTESWQAWLSLLPEDRAALARLFLELDQQENGRAVLAEGRRFAAIDEAMRKRLRTIDASLAEVLAELPAAQRRSLRTLPAEGRAAQLFRIMESRHPRQLAALREQRLNQN